MQNEVKKMFVIILINIKLKNVKVYDLRVKQWKFNYVDVHFLMFTCNIIINVKLILINIS